MNITLQAKKNEFGEILTPPFLVEKMLDSLPNEVWRNPKLRWIDNSCGTGNFLVSVFERLKVFHQEEFILNEMLFGVDIQPDNVEETKKRLPIKNLVCADALCFDYWGRKQFDIVLGNPPYNKSKVKAKKGNRCNPLWVSFINQALQTLLAQDGYLLMVHPPLWRKPGHALWKEMAQRQLCEINILSTKETTKIFGIPTKVDWYLLRNSVPTKKTKIVDEQKVMDFVQVWDKPFIPNSNIHSVYQIFSAVDQKVIYSCKYHHYTAKDILSEIPTETHQYPCVYLANNKGVQYRWSSKNSLGHFGEKKIIIPMGSYHPILDLEGKYGMCEVAFGIPVDDDEQGNRLFRFLSSEDFRKILTACKWKTVQYDWKLFRHFNKQIVDILG